MITIERDIISFLEDYKIVFGRNEISKDFKKTLRPSPGRWNRTDFMHSNYYLIISNLRQSLEIYINNEEETVEISLKDIVTNKEEYVKHTLEWLWTKPYNLNVIGIVENMLLKLYCTHPSTQPILGWENTEIGDYCLECGASIMIHNFDKPKFKGPNVV